MPVSRRDLLRLAAAAPAAVGLGALSLGAMKGPQAPPTATAESLGILPA